MVTTTIRSCIECPAHTSSGPREIVPKEGATIEGIFKYHRSGAANLYWVHRCKLMPERKQGLHLEERDDEDGFDGKIPLDRCPFALYEKDKAEGAYG